MSIIKVNSIQHSGAANASIELNANGRVAFSNTVAFSGTVSVANDLLLGGNTVSPFANAGREIVDLFGSTDSVVVLRNPSGNTYLQRFGTECYLNNQTGNTFLTTGQSVVFQAGGNERMRIDSAGRVTTPSQPFFSAFRNTGQTYSSNQTIIWNATLHNVGNHYNTTTGFFTAPVAGVYAFRADYRSDGTNTTTALDIVRSDGLTTRHEEATGNPFNQFHQTLACFYYLSAGDYVYCRATAGNIRPDAGNIDRFEGFLVG